MYDSRQLIMSGPADGPIERYTAVAIGITPTSYARAISPGPIVVGLQSNVNTAIGERADVVLSGPHKGRLGGLAVSRGSWLKPDGLGRLINAVAGDWAIARAEQSGNGGEVIDVFVHAVKI